MLERLHADQPVVATGRVDRPDLRRYVDGMVLLDVSALATDSAGGHGRVRGLCPLGLCICLGPKKRACYVYAAISVLTAYSIGSSRADLAP